MSGLTEKMQSWWQGLADSDRRTLLFSFPVVVLLLMYLLVFQPIINHFSEVKAQKEQLETSLVWLYENAALVDRMRNQCSRSRLVARGDDDLITYARNIGRRSGASPQLSQTGNDQIQVKINNAPGTRVLSALQSYVCHGYSLSELSLIRRSPDSSEVDLSVQLTASGFLRGN